MTGPIKKLKLSLRNDLGTTMRRKKERKKEDKSTLIITCYYPPHTFVFFINSISTQSSSRAKLHQAVRLDFWNSEYTITPSPSLSLLFNDSKNVCYFWRRNVFLRVCVIPSLSVVVNKGGWRSKKTKIPLVFTLRFLMAAWNKEFTFMLQVS